MQVRGLQYALLEQLQERKDSMAGGRPIIEIDKKQFEQLCAMQCTQAEICSWFNITDKTLTRWCKQTYKKSFSEVFKIKRQKGFTSLRRNQWEMAETNPTMAIWLGKQYLGQSDKREDKVEVGADGFLEAITKRMDDIKESGIIEE